MKNVSNKSVLLLVKNISEDENHVIVKLQLNAFLIILK